MRAPRWQTRSWRSCPLQCRVREKCPVKGSGEGARPAAELQDALLRMSPTVAMSVSPGSAPFEHKRPLRDGLELRRQDQSRSIRESEA